MEESSFENRDASKRLEEFSCHPSAMILTHGTKQMLLWTVFLPTFETSKGDFDGWNQDSS